MNIFTNYLEKLGSNFLVSAMIPSLAFVVACIFMFDPILHVAASFNDPQSTLQLVGFGLIIFILTVIVGFTLTVLNTHILKIFEGYIIFPPLKFLYNKSLRIYQAKARELIAQRDSLKEKYISLKKAAKDDSEFGDKLERIINEHYKIASDYDQNYPANIGDVLPTKFGNALRAAEDHAMQRYGFDGVTFWPRLIHVIPDSYKSTIDSARNELSFLANMSILSIVFSLLCFPAIIHGMLLTNVVSGNAAVFLAFLGSISKYFIAAIAGIVGSRLFYNASIISLSSFTLMVRSSFDLFRLDLLKKLEIQKPRDFDQECDIWVNLNELILLGNQSLIFQKFAYRKEDKSK